MSGGGQEVARPRAETRGRRQQQKPSLPFDVMVEIAACSDPTTLVRFAATCREARHRVADGDAAFRGRLRLRHTDRFVLPLLRGHLTGDYVHRFSGTARELNMMYKQELWLVDTTVADATRLVKVRRGFASSPSGENLTGLQPVSSREGLLLIRTTNKMYNREELLVCNPATRRSQTLPPQPDTFPVYSRPYHVLLAGDGETSGTSEVGRPFQVLKARIVTSDYRSERCMQIQTFSSEHGIWGPFTEIRTPNLLGRAFYKSSRPLVEDGVVHWLCLTSGGSYVLMLHVKAERVTLTTLPTRFPDVEQGQHVSYLLAKSSMGGSLIVLVADEEKISMWVQCKHTKRWKDQTQVVIRNKEILEFDNVGSSLAGPPNMVLHIKLVWFSERSGAVLIKIPYRCLFWLDLQSKKIVRWFYDDRIRSASVYCPYEMDLSSWVPTFSSGLVN